MCNAVGDVPVASTPWDIWAVTDSGHVGHVNAIFRPQSVNSTKTPCLANEVPRAVAFTGTRQPWEEILAPPHYPNNSYKRFLMALGVYMYVWLLTWVLKPSPASLSTFFLFEDTVPGLLCDAR
ncbi:hypothetical protein MAP00_004738 [Monascus purpureus]|nr:hypothetical protein MAP00_004738 [Monascus purpureus]